MEKEKFKKDLTDYITRNLNIINPMINKAINSKVFDIESLDEDNKYRVIRAVTFAILTDIANSFKSNSIEGNIIVDKLRKFL